MADPTLQNQLVAVIDIGTSAIRTVIAEINPKGEIRHLENLQMPVPFGAEVFQTGRISAKLMGQALSVLSNVKQVMASYGVQTVQAIATSAVREATNRDNFTDRIYVRTGIDVEVIEGPEENRLSLIAIEHALAGQVRLEERNALIVEVGSGSTELIVLSRGNVNSTRTLPIGSIRLPDQAVAGKTDAVTLRRVLKRAVHSVAAYTGRQGDFYSMDTFIALGGDIRFLARSILGEIRDPFTVVNRKDALRFIEKLGKQTPEEIVSVHGIPYEQAQTLYPALLIYQYFFQETVAEQILVPMVSIRDGLLVELAQMLSGYKRTDVSKQVLNSARHIGKKYQYDKAHSLHVATLAMKLYDMLAPEHGLASRERLLLEVSAILHDIGTFISPTAHHKHSSYLVDAEEIFGLRKAEKDIVSYVVRYHRRSPPSASDSGYMSLTKSDRAIISKLTAILRVADALDKSHQQKILQVDLERGDDAFTLWAPADSGDITVERNALAKKGEMFADVFGVAASLKQKVSTL